MNNLNTSLFWFFNNLAGQSPFSDAIIVFLAEYLPYLVGALFVAAIILLPRASLRNKLEFGLSLAVASVASAGIIVQGIRFFYHHLRPFAAMNNVHQLIAESGYSFPSRHATFFFALSAVAYQYNKKLGWLFFILSALIGLARIAVGVHWPYDIFGGAVLGVLAGWLSVVLVRFFLESKSASS